MLECALLRPITRGFSRESRQDHRYHDHRNPQYSVLRPFFRLAGRLILPSSALFTLFVCLFIAAAPIPALAQDEDEVVRVNTDLLLFPVRIRDKKGQAVTGLSDQDLLLKDQDQATTGIYFSPGADRVALMFALDQSGSLACLLVCRSDRTRTIIRFRRWPGRAPARRALTLRPRTGFSCRYR